MPFCRQSPMPDSTPHLRPRTRPIRSSSPAAPWQRNSRRHSPQSLVASLRDLPAGHPAQPARAHHRSRAREDTRQSRPPIAASCAFTGIAAPAAGSTRCWRKKAWSASRAPIATRSMRASAPSMQMMEEEIGTFFLTDYLVRFFDRLVMEGLGLDRHPELLADYFGNYTQGGLARAGARRRARATGTSGRGFARPSLGETRDRLAGSRGLPCAPNIGAPCRDRPQHPSR